MLMRIVRERWYYYIFILAFIVIILFSILQTHNYLIRNAENDLDEEIALFSSELSSEYSRFESEMIYNSSINTFRSAVDEDILNNEVKEKIRRVYSMNIDIIDKISVYDEKSRREFVIEDLNYFKVSPLINEQGEVLSKVKTYMYTGEKYKLIIPVYNNNGVLESNVALELDIKNFINSELKSFYLGESSWAWYYDEYDGLSLIGDDSTNESYELKLSGFDYVISRLKQGYKGKLSNTLSLEKDNPVISSFYPIKIGTKELAVGFSVSRDMILGQINLVIIIIVISFLAMILLIVLLFLKLINDEVKIKIELEKSNDTLDMILKEIPTTVIIHREDLAIVYINDFGRKQLAYSDDVSYGHLTMKDSFPNFTLENKVDIKYILDLGHKKSNIIKNTVPIEYYGDEMFITAIVDTSAIEEARKLAEESNRLKSEFIANISHEIRTPMNGIIASAEILLGMDASVEQKEYISIIEQSSNHLMVIINDILDLSKIESGKLIIEEIHFNTRDTIESVYDQFIIKANQKKIEIINDINVNVPSHLVGDPNRLKQVLTNLIGNAVKFTSKGFIYIGVDLEKVSSGYAKLLFTIADTGIGISNDALKDIFEPFIQADGSITRNYGGTGLGTTISKKIVNEMGGNISVESPNTLFKSDLRGTVFTFDITFKLGNENNSDQKEEDIFKDISALIVEDNPINIKIIERMLSIWGVESKIAYNIEDAIMIARNHDGDFDVLVSDMILQDSYCDELLKRLEEIQKMPDYVTIVSSDSNYNRVSSLRNRGYDIILKPIKQSSLFNVFKLYSENIETRKKLLEYKLAARADDSVEDVLREDANVVKIDYDQGEGHDSINDSNENNKSKKTRILVAEDNAINMKIILKYLSKFKLDILSVSNGKEAVDLLEYEDVDIVFMDLQMPILNGIDATKIIRKNDAELIIVAMTANAMDLHKKAIYEAGMNDFLSKPLKYIDIKNILSKYIEL